VFSNTGYVLAETGGPAGYTASDWSCDNGVTVTGGTITLTEGQTGVTCTINNDDNPSSLKLVKTVDNDDGGNAVVADFQLFISGAPVDSGVVNARFAGDWVASETTLSGYTPGDWGGDCDADGSITLALGQHATCTITNDDVAPTLKLVKQVNNDNGGDGVPADWTLTAIAEAPSDGRNYSELGNHGTFETVYANTVYVLTETPNPGAGYVAWLPGCDNGVIVDASGGTYKITLDEGQTDVTCTLFNVDIAPTLKLVKTVDNGDGGTAVPNNWTLTATAEAPKDGRNYSETGDHDAFETMYSNTDYVLAETGGPAGYTAGDWSCDSGVTVTGSTITLDEGQTGVTCTINNDDIAPTLQLNKLVVNNNGGTAVASDFELTATGTSGSFSGNPVSGTDPRAGSVGPNPVTSGVTYALSETGPAGYVPAKSSDPGDPDTYWSCAITPAGSTTPGDAAPTDEITLAPGESLSISTAVTLLFPISRCSSAGHRLPAVWQIHALRVTGWQARLPRRDMRPVIGVATVPLTDLSPSPLASTRPAPSRTMMLHQP